MPKRPAEIVTDKSKRKIGFISWDSFLPISILTLNKKNRIEVVSFGVKGADSFVKSTLKIKKK